MMKLILSPRTKQGMSRAQLRQHLEFVHAPLCLAHDEVGGRFAQYIHHYVLDGYEEQLGKQLMPERDAVTCIWFQDSADFRASVTNEVFKKYIAPDEDNFREVEGSIGVEAREWTARSAISAVSRKLIAFRKVPGNPAEAAERWAERVASRLASDSASAIASFTANAVESAFSAVDFNQIDELGFDKEIEVAALLTLYRKMAKQEFGDLSAQMLITEPRIFRSL